MKAKPQISSVVLRQIGAVEDWLPKIGRPVSRRVTHIEDGRFLFSLRLTGIPFEAQTDGVIVNMFDNLSEMFGKLGRDFGGRLAYWVTFSRRGARSINGMTSTRGLYGDSHSVHRALYAGRLFREHILRHPGTSLRRL